MDNTGNRAKLDDEQLDTVAGGGTSRTPLFQMGDRVKVKNMPKLGIGTIVSQPRSAASGATYQYDVKLESRPSPISYYEPQLEKADQYDPIILSF